ncbi:MAG: HPr family phosphocarrier protein [Campylobacterota bacterium]|nr:HPr family phosphocarrier protein [Campylobacterota bacterium]
MTFLKYLFSKAHTEQFTITSSNGFHLRPVAQFVNMAKTFSCQINATFNSKTVDAKNINTLLSLSLEKGDSFTLEIKGKKAEVALEELHALFETLMHHDVEVKQIKKASHSYKSVCIKAEIISEGIAIAPLYHYHTKELISKSTLSFQEAVLKALDELENLYTTHKENNNAPIYLAQKALLDSLTKDAQTIELFTQQIDDASSQLLGTKLEAKRSDYQDILKRVKKHLGIELSITFPDTPFVLMAHDLLPSEVDLLTKTEVLGVILKETSILSHTAILLRSMGVTSLICDTTQLQEGANIIVDAHAGVVVHTPNKEDLQKANRQLKKDRTQNEIAFKRRFNTARTTKGQAIKVFANVADTHSAHKAKEEGAEGIGLLRSEFLFKEKQPTLELQVEAYEEIFALFKEVTVRTLDIGGDKNLPYINLPKESNPFLGIRGVRLFHTHPQIIAQQLQAIFIAAKGKTVKIMFPMISSVEEFNEAKAFAINVAKEHKLNIENIHFGMMIEVPSVLFLIEAFNEIVDFYSIGTNDLTQYLFAIERTHPTLKTDTLSPVIFSAISSIVQKATKPVSICGELASNKKAIAKLLHCGIELLSVSPSSIAQTKEEIRNV